MALIEEEVEIDKVIVQEDFSYGDHALQKLTVYHHFGENKSPDGGGLFLIYIHGGAWRDPTITDKSFYPTIRHLYSCDSYRELMNAHITAIASLSYRLSAHPAHPQPPSTPTTELREARHPDHLRDVISAISFLQAKYRFGSRYMVVGHSCGATLAFQSLQLRESVKTSRAAPVPFENPEVVVGVAGIYDFRLLRDSNPHPAYQEFLVGAFGEDERAWDYASPAKNELVKVWPEAETVVLVSSSNDGLVDNGQIDCMGASLKGMGEEAKVLVLKDFFDIPHDVQWQEGAGLASVVAATLQAWNLDDCKKGRGE
ncbi:uncharacterized protein L3040_008857 [Drepanopeziza brunnea f. sp. 'multigermtubi']|nr:hypothetical protein L3040_008857 [Drepanopeziza brunnea f. sp. 'multigermtubi']